MDPLKAYLVKHFGLAADADEAAVRKMASEKLTTSQVMDIVAPKAAETSPLEKLALVIDGVLSKRLASIGIAPVAGTDGASAADGVNVKAAQIIQANGIGVTLPDSQLQPSELLAPAAKAAGAPGAGGAPNVKKASAGLSDTKSRLIYPRKGVSGQYGGNGRMSDHPQAGMDVFDLEGKAAYAQSDREKVLSGAFMKHKLACYRGRQHLHDDYTKSLLEECVREMEFVGDMHTPLHGTYSIDHPRKLTELEIKAVLSDVTSGGTNVVPYVFETELITYPLLYNELFPLMTVLDIDQTNQIIQGNIQNMTINTGPGEDGTTNIALQSTASLIGKLTWNIFNATGSVLFGRDFLSDTPTNVLQTVMRLYTAALGQWIDNAGATGDGTTAPKGVFNTGSTNTYSFKNSTAGPMTVTDWEQMMASMPYQYRKGKKKSIVWLMKDSMWFRIRGLAVSSTDQRRIFGYDNEAYTFYGHDVKINESIAAGSVALVDMENYVMYRRRGLDFQQSVEGRTNMLLNEMLVVARSRWGGQITKPASVVIATNGSLHS